MPLVVGARECFGPEPPLASKRIDAGLKAHAWSVVGV